MNHKQNIQMRSVARVEIEANLKRVYHQIRARRYLGHHMLEIEDQYARKFKTYTLQFSKANLQELSARLLALPQEVRSMVYKHLWNFKPNHEDFMSLIFRNGQTSPCSGPLGAVPSCRCFSNVAHFLDPGIMDKQVVLEILGALHKRVGKSSSDQHKGYTLGWKYVPDFATRDLLHLGLTLHGILPNHRLKIDFDCLDETRSDWSLGNLGIPGGINDQLQRTATALCRLSLEDPRPVEFAFIDRIEGVPSNLEFVLRTLSVPFHQLKQRGFGVRVTYNHRLQRQYTCRDCGKWDLGKDGWSLDPSDVWEWTLRDWNLNFTRANSCFQPRDGYVPNPNGYICEKYKSKITVWEGIRRYLYRYQPDVEKAVILKKIGGTYFLACGCAPWRHTCSDYFLCDKHGGWPYWRSGLNLACWKCAEGQLGTAYY